MPNTDKISALFKLLDDEDQQIAMTAMNELLAQGKPVENILREYQESPDSALRKRVHQMQAIIRARKTKDILSRRMNNRATGLWNGLVEIHLLWYDKENKDILEMDINWLVEKFKPGEKPSSEYFAETMKKLCYVVSIGGDIDADFYCVGSVINSKIGADFILCAIIKKVASYFSWNFEIVSEKERFAVIGPDNSIVDPYTWNVIYSPDISKLKKYTTGEILKITALHLFLGATCSDSHRYIYSIGKCISNASEKNSRFLPYPFLK